MSASIDGAHLEIVCSAPASHPGAFAAVTTVSHPVQALTWGRPLRVPLVQADVVVTLHVLRAESAEDATNGVADPIADIYLPVAELASVGIDVRWCWRRVSGSGRSASYRRP